MNTKRVSKTIALLLALVMAFAMLPVASAAAETEPSAESVEMPVSGDPTYVLNAGDLEVFEKETKADGDMASAGTDGYFAIHYAKNSSVNSNSKTFADGFVGTKRLNFGGKSSFGDLIKNAIRFTTKNPSTVKIWWVANKADRTTAIYNSTFDSVFTSEVPGENNKLMITEATLDAAGTYYIGFPVGGNYIFKIEVTEHLPKEYVLDAGDLEVFEKETKADGDMASAGTKDFFTIHYAKNSSVNSNSKTFADGFVGTKRLNFGGKSSFGDRIKNAIHFTTTGSSTVKIWWVANKADRTTAIYNSKFDSVFTSEVPGENNKLMITQTTLDAAGTYYIGFPVGGNYIFKISVTDGGGAEVVRGDWAEVAAPVIASAVQTEGDIKVTVSAEIGVNGGDDLTVTMLDAQGNELASKKSLREATEHTLTFTPEASGEYTFKATLTRKGEESVKEAAETKTVSYVLPLAKPAITSATSLGGGKIEVIWDAVKEADSYELYCGDTKAATTTDTKCTVSGLTVGTEYSFTVVALRGTDRSEASAPIAATATAEQQTTWSFSAFGQGVNTANNGYLGNANDGSVTVYSENGKGKIVPGSTDGIAFYYTAIPTEYNFTLRANVHVDKWTLSNGQEGFGLLAADRVGTHGNGNSFWNNSYMALASKVEYSYDPETGAIYEANDTRGVKASMKLGLGVTAKTGLTMDSLNRDPVKDLTSVTQTLETYAAENGLNGTLNIVGNATKEVPGTVQQLTDFVLEIQKNNTGYFITYYDAEGNVLRQLKNYDPNALSMMDKENVYAGFFASRNARVTFSNIYLSKILASEDKPAEERPITKIEPVVTIASASSSNTEHYTLSLNANVKGDAKVTVNGTVVAEAATVTGKVRCDIPVKLKVGKNDVEVVFTPDPDQDLGEATELASTDPITVTATVTYETKYSGQNNLYIAPNGTPDGNGSKEQPLDVYTAVKIVQPGQTIVVMEGTYKLNKTVRIERGINGTADKFIRMVADPEAATRPVFDFQGACAGIVHGGDYWYFNGFDVTNSANGQKGFQVSGDHNTLDRIEAYHNGNTGIQISRYSSADLYPDWPAYNLILNCTSYGNADSGYEDADGFAAKLTVGDGNVFDGCVAYNNADDGWDLFAKVETGSIGIVTIQNCVAFCNGYLEDGTNAGNGNGFKMGGDNLSGYHKIINSVAFCNKAKGIDSNNCPDIQVENCTSYNNEKYNVAFYTKAKNTDFAATGILSFKDATIKSGLSDGDNLKPEGTQDKTKYTGNTNYYWNGSASKNAAGDEVTADMFVSLTYKGFVRRENGTIDLQGFLELNEKAPKDAGARLSGTSSGEVVITPDPTKPTEPDPTMPTEPTTPATGDNTPIVPLIIVMVVALVALIVVLVVMFKKRYKGKH